MHGALGDAEPSGQFGAEAPLTAALGASRAQEVDGCDQAGIVGGGMVFAGPVKLPDGYDRTGTRHPYGRDRRALARCGRPPALQSAFVLGKNRASIQARCSNLFPHAV